MPNVTDRRTLWTAGIAGLALFGVDRLTKELARAYLSDGGGEQAIAVTHGLLYLRWAENSAGFLGFLDGIPPAARAPAFLVATALLVWLLVHLIRAAARGGHTNEVLALTLVLAGGLGNGYDRLVHGAVIDCMYLMIGESFRTYLNIADLAIAIGVLWMFRLHLWPAPKKPLEPASG